MTKGLHQYLQDAEQLCASEANYFDYTVRPTNTSPMSETEEQVNQTSQNNLTTAKQESIDETELTINILESLKTDTSHPLQWQTVTKSTSQQGIDRDITHQYDQLSDEEEQDTSVHGTDVLHNDDDHIAIDTVADGTSIQPEEPITQLFPINDVTIPSEKIGCIFVTRLQQFLEGYLPS